MGKWDSDIFCDNHLKLMKYHIGFFAIYFIALIVMAVASMQGDSSAIGRLILLALPVFLHGMLAYGSCQKYELSRKVSEIIFAIFLVGFPVGTLLSMYVFLPATEWKEPEAKG